MSHGPRNGPTNLHHVRQTCVSINILHSLFHLTIASHSANNLGLGQTSAYSVQQHQLSSKNEVALCKKKKKKKIASDAIIALVFVGVAATKLWYVATLTERKQVT